MHTGQKKNTISSLWFSYCNSSVQLLLATTFFKGLFLPQADRFKVHTRLLWKGKMCLFCFRYYHSHLFLPGQSVVYPRHTLIVLFMLNAVTSFTFFPMAVFIFRGSSSVHHVCRNDYPYPHRENRFQTRAHTHPPNSLSAIRAHCTPLKALYDCYALPVFSVWI